MAVCKTKARRTIEAQWQERDIPPYQMDEVEVRHNVTTFDVLPSLHDNLNGIDLFVDLSDVMDLTPQDHQSILTTVMEEEKDETNEEEDEEEEGIEDEENEDGDELSF